MKKLHLNKIFHWLYAFLMFYPILCFFGTIVISAFNNTLSFSDYSFDNLSSYFWQIIENCAFRFEADTVGSKLYDVYYFVFSDLLGPDDSVIPDLVVGLLTYWTSVSLVYLIFDVLMLPINIAHHWIDKGSDRL